MKDLQVYALGVEEKLHHWPELQPQRPGVPSSFCSALHPGWSSAGGERKEGSGWMADCCGSCPPIQQRKYASCCGIERRSDEKMSNAEGSDFLSVQSVVTWGWCWRTCEYHRG